MECRAKTGHKSHMDPNDDDIPRISNLRPGRVDYLDGVGMEISPILMPGSKMDHVARHCHHCPKGTKFVVEV